MREYDRTLSYSAQQDVNQLKLSNVKFWYCQSYKEFIVNRTTAAGGTEVSVLAIEQASNYIWIVFLTWEYGRAPGEGEQ